MPTNDLLTMLGEKIRNYSGRQLRIMEVCGTHTHENFRLGIRSMLPENIRLIAGPGCPVCVTSAAYIDEAIFLASRGLTVCSFGDLLRVRGSGGTLSEARANGCRIKIVYSPLDALDYAKKNPHEQVVFLSVGFETTTPISCLAAKKAVQQGLDNFSILTANKTMTNAYYKLAGSADAFLYPGHVSAITGTGIYKMLLQRGISGVAAGFSAIELLMAINAIIYKSQNDEPYFVNCYKSVVAEDGNPRACAIVDEMMESCDAQWRGLGIIEGSGMKLRDEYSSVDARLKFCVPEFKQSEPAGCRCGDVLRGLIEPPDCPLFGKSCLPENPSGACMVSSEGACAAYYKYGRL
jgi:hydrogenase expression/formation protein HypD